tara:strand:- start:1965 stop:2171 length:207 start_codon:yes stop_codon:yes gene_type:complete
MILYTKYGIGSEVWAIMGNKISNGKIESLEYSSSDSGKDFIMYWLVDDRGSYSESELFPSKKELLESL